MDRIHRLGQHRPVQAIKLIVEDSIESRIVQVCVAPQMTSIPYFTVARSYRRRSLLWWTRPSPLTIQYVLDLEVFFCLTGLLGHGSVDPRRRAWFTFTACSFLLIAVQLSFLFRVSYRHHRLLIYRCQLY